ncbi:MAG: sodium-dependent transporter [Marinoscillum sp.]|jgi:NSS family neurotransmitter:Na+ symporter
MRRENWGSRFGFIMATAGFAVGMGNIWRFPYIVGESGGGAFLIVYLILTAIIGIPLLTAEISLGRKAQLTPLKGMKKLSGDSSFWNIIGWVEITATLLILGFYLMIMAWVTVYLKEYITGEAFAYNSTNIQSHFVELQENSSSILLYCLGIALLIAFVLARGLQGGVELVSKIFMPILLVMFILLAIGSNTLEGSEEGLKWYLSPDFSKINFQVILAALGQIFFSIGIALTAGFVFGSYLDPKKSDIPGSVGIVVLFDTAIAILAGFVIFPALFAFDIEPNAGPGLLFVTMASLFKEVPFGMFFGGVFFFLVFIAGFTSIIGLIEAIISTIIDSMNTSRIKAVIITVSTTFLLTIPSVLGFGVWQDIQPLGFSFFGLFDFISGKILLPLGGILISVYVAYIWGFSNFMRETNEGAKSLKVTKLWGFLMKYVIPIIIFIILVQGLRGVAMD